ncbi:MAG: hypothetical protein ACTSO9_08705 [Candidatus Helarchaeota archaeon]
MAFEEGKKMIPPILEELLRKENEIIESAETHMNQILEDDIKDLENKIKEAEISIESNTKEIEYIKKSLKVATYTKEEKESELKQKEELIEFLKNKLKEYPKTISNLPKEIDKRTKEYKRTLNDMYKNLPTLLRLFTERIELKKLLEMCDEHLTFIIHLNNLVKFEKFIRVTKLNFKVKSTHNIEKISNFNQYMSIFIESIIFYILDLLSQEKLLKDKQKLAELALSYAKGILNYLDTSENTENEISNEYYKDLEKFCESELSSIVGQKELSTFNLVDATSHLLYAKETLKSINNLGQNFKSIISEKLEITEAWASDAYHLIYLLNSYRHWRNVSNSKDPEIKEIAQITKDKIENFITSQYGFPKEDHIKKITSAISWPSAAAPSIFEKISPKY